MIETKLNIAMVQTNLIWEDISANLNLFENKFDSIKEGTDLIVLPEMFSTGFTMNTALAESMNGESVQWMTRQAKKLQLHVCGSLIIKEKEKTYNRFVFVYPDGTIDFYDKRHLFSMAKEDKHFTSGSSHKIINVNGFKINLMVCYDLRFPVWSRNSLKDGQHHYDVLLYIANWPSVRSSVWRNLLQARAAENMAYVVGVNRVGKDKNELSYDGSTMMVDPWGTVVVQSAIDKEEIYYGKLDMAILSRARKKFPVANDADVFNLLQ